MINLRSLHPLFIVVGLVILAVVATLSYAETAVGAETPAQAEPSIKPAPDAGKVKPPAPAQKPVYEGTMTLDRIDGIINRLDAKAKRTNDNWQLVIEKIPVVVVTDKANDRMRILVAVRKTEGMKPEELQRLMQANFDSALDSRYAIANNILWATYIHPLQELHDRQFIAAIGQTVNLALTYGSSYSSGLLLFGGGDSRAIIRRQLIDKLLKKGQPI